MTRKKNSFGLSPETKKKVPMILVIILVLLLFFIIYKMMNKKKHHKIKKLKNYKKYKPMPTATNSPISTDDDITTTNYLKLSSLSYPGFFDSYYNGDSKDNNINSCLNYIKDHNSKNKIDDHYIAMSIIGNTSYNPEKFLPNTCLYYKKKDLANSFKVGSEDITSYCINEDNDPNYKCLPDSYPQIPSPDGAKAYLGYINDYIEGTPNENTLQECNDYIKKHNENNPTDKIVAFSKRNDSSVNGEYKNRCVYYKNNNLNKGELLQTSNMTTYCVDNSKLASNKCL